MISTYTKNIIPVLQQNLANQPIERAWLFGSCSRGEETEDSDIDLLVEYNKSSRISLMVISRIMCVLKKAIGRNVDLVEEGHLKAFAVDSVNHDKILIYERENKG